MSRIIRDLCFFLIGFFIVGSLQFAFAETIASTAVTNASVKPRYWAAYAWSGCTQSQNFQTPEACAGSFGNVKDVCQQVVTNYGVRVYVSLSTAGSCAQGVGTRQICPGGSTAVYNTAGKYCQATGTTYTCPDSSWTLSADKLTCSRPDACLPGQELVNGNCMAKCVAPESRDVAGFCRSWCGQLVVTTTGTCLKKIVCSENANMNLGDLSGVAICSDQKEDTDKCPPGGVVVGTFEGKPICISPPPSDADCEAIGGTVTGTLNGKPVCSKQDQNPSCSDGTPSQGTINGQPVCNGGCPSGSAMGTVNGVSACYPMGGTTDKTTTQKGDGETGTTTETETKDGSGNTTGTTSRTGNSTTTCTGDRCTTKSETTDGSGNKTTTTTTEDKGDYCAKNPKASVCTGDTEHQSYCKDNPKAASCGELGDFGTVDAMPTKSLGVSSIVPAIFSSNATCPADINLPKGATFTFSSLCTFASGIRPFVLITAWLVAAFFVLGIKTD